MTTTTAARFLLFGDSHAGPIGRAAKDREIPFVGGPIGAGREFNTAFFDAREDDIVFRKAETNDRFRGFLAELGASKLSEVTVPLVTTMGFGVHFFAIHENWQIYRLREETFDEDFLGGPLFNDIIHAMAGEVLRFYRLALEMRLRLISVMPPQRIPGIADPAVFMAAQETLRRELLAFGVEVVDLRPETTDPEGLQLPAYCETDDPLHGNLAFGRLILAELERRGV